MEDFSSFSSFSDSPNSRNSPERVWDEYDWERFLRQQDAKTEKYIDLLEKYQDHPKRDQIIAKEMGWQHLVDESGKDWCKNLDALFESGGSQDGNTCDENDSQFDEAFPQIEEPFPQFNGPSLQHVSSISDRLNEDLEEELGSVSYENEERHHQHPLYQLANALPIWINNVFDNRNEFTQLECFVRLTSEATLTGVKLAAALGDPHNEELGMTIAYLKRALRAVTNTLEAAIECDKKHLIDPLQNELLRIQIFQIRDGIISLMGDYRQKLRDR